MSTSHVLYAFEEAFIEDGIVAVCTCGWRSAKHITQGNAIEDHAKHAEEKRTRICKACECPIDADGCGCNPEGA